MAEAFEMLPLTPRRVVCLAGGLCILWLAATVVALRLGAVPVGWGDIWRLLWQPGAVDETTRLVVLGIRLPRTLLAGLTGAVLSLGGAVFQAVLRNPLADPFILGVSSGAALGGLLGMAAGWTFQGFLPLSSFSGALLTTFLLLALAGRGKGLGGTHLLLTGVIINAFFGAIIMYVVATTSDDRLYAMLFWLYGDLGRADYGACAVEGAVALLGFGGLYRLAYKLNILTTGEETALQLGVDVPVLKRVCLVLVSLVVGVAVAFAGIIGFVGLIVPHVIRLLWGADHRLLLPAAALGGGIFLVLADALARTLAAPLELPVGVVTAFCGAPFFLYLLYRRAS